MKKIPFDIKYRPEIESGKYTVETRDGRKAEILKWNAKQRYYENGVFLIVCVDCGEDVPCIYTSEGFYYGPNIEKDLFHLDLVIVTDEPDEHPQITEFKEHLSSLSEEERQKEWQELQDWFGEHFKPEHRDWDWVEDFRKDIEAMSQEEFDEKWNEIKRRCGGRYGRKSC